MEKYETVIWDLDGTLIDSFGVVQEVLADILPDMGLDPPTEQRMRENYHGSLNDSINNALGGVEPAVLEQIIAQFLIVQNDHYEVVEHHLFTDAKQLVERLHDQGAYQLIVTNRNHVGRLNASPLSIVERSSLKGFIDKVISGDDSQHRKPSLEVLGDFLQTRHIEPTTTLVIGDQFVDAEFAKNIGADALLVAREGGITHIDRLGPDYQNYVTVVTSLDSVL